MNSALKGISSLRLHWVRSVSHDKHIFVIGPPRSGTTLLFRILVAHPAIGGPVDETFFFCRRRFDNLSFPGVDREATLKFTYEAHDKVDLFDKLLSYLRDEQNVSMLCEKTPEHALFIKSLLRWYPQSFFIFMMRDGRDCLASATRNPVFWAKAHATYGSLWHQIAKNFLDVRNNKQVLPVFYERLCKCPFDTIKNAMAFLGLEYCDQQILPSFLGETTLAHRRGHQRLREPISTASVGTWKSTLDYEQIQTFDRLNSRLLHSLGYEA